MVGFLAGGGLLPIGFYEYIIPQTMTCNPFIPLSVLSNTNVVIPDDKSIEGLTCLNEAICGPTSFSANSGGCSLIR